jgi:Glycosyltransferase Family 4
LTRKPRGTGIKLAMVATHPIQYQAHWFRSIAAEPNVDFEVLFCHNATPSDQAQAGFGVPFRWDLPLLEGYPHRFLRNAARVPSCQTFRGMDTPDLSKIVRDYDAVIVSGWHYKSAWQAIYGCWRSETPVLMRGDSHLHTERALAKKLLKRPFYRAAIPRFDACLAVGKWSTEYFLHYGARPDRVFFVPHSVDDERFSANRNNTV